MIFLLKKNIQKIIRFIKNLSLQLAIYQQKYSVNITELRNIVPDISDQESSEQKHHDKYFELKRRGLHLFQCDLMLRSINEIEKEEIVVADIGDSAGTHMLYLKDLNKNKIIDTYSVNLDNRAINRINKRGLKSILKRAEDIEPDDIGGNDGVDLFTSFQMVEHLHNPAIFFKRIASKMSSNRMVITVPFLRQSRVGLHNIRNHNKGKIYAEDEHVFELSPEDWTLLFLHSGWKVSFHEVYYQYPRKIPIITSFFKYLWKRTDYEGFWGAILEKDTYYSDLYQDWDL